MRHLVFGLVMALLLSSSGAEASPGSLTAFVTDAATGSVLEVSLTGAGMAAIPPRSGWRCFRMGHECMSATAVSTSAPMVPFL